MILHTLNAMADTGAFRDCLRLVMPGDSILLTGDGVYCALANTGPCTLLSACGADIFALAPDVAAAGVTTMISPTVELIDYDGFVTLSEHYQQQMAWY